MILIVCELIVVVCFCLVDFSFASFFLGPGVTLFFPYKQLLINKGLEYWEEAQLKRMGFSAHFSEMGNI